jgi:hypothetical protein
VTIYLHQRKDGTQKRLIKTTHPSKAYMYVAKKEFTCEPATADTCVELMRNGIKVEDADAKEQTSDMFTPSTGNGSTPTYEEAGGE